MPARTTPSRATTQMPSWLAVCAAGSVGSAFGFAFGLLSLNRPLANALAFSVLGFVVGAALALGSTTGLRVSRRSRVGRSTGSRSRGVRHGLLAVLTAVLLLLAHAAFVVPRLIDEQELRVPVPNLGAGWEGEQIAVIADLQVGMWGANLGTVERIVSRIVVRDPAAVLVAGDLLYSTDPDPSAQTSTVLELLRPLLVSDIPVFVVLGNHDHATGYATELAVRLEREGIAVLRNEAQALRADGADGPLYVVGIGARRPGLDDPRQALRGVPAAAPRVVVMHNPVSFLELPPDSAPIAFAGHTHCGQVVLPVGDGLSRLELRVEERYVIEGFAPAGYGAAGNELYVTCGIGFSRVPLRLGAEPQVVFATLTEPDGDR